mmetsp:Transcript_88229/g.201610  ORF Transcript_88229/g.201610 Transcript_88229/m.201610 type:complete len:109 (+) Transcript_88229:112-438(+)
MKSGEAHFKELMDTPLLALPAWFVEISSAIRLPQQTPALVLIWTKTANNKVRQLLEKTKRRGDITTTKQKVLIFALNAKLLLIAQKNVAKRTGHSIKLVVMTPEFSSC